MLDYTKTALIVMLAKLNENIGLNNQHILKK